LRNVYKAALMACISAYVLNENQRLANVHKDFGQGRSKEVVYIVKDRSYEWIVMGQSLPAIAKFINIKISDGPWSNATVTGLFENMNREGSRNGGYHRGRYRICSVPLDSARDVFEEARQDYVQAAVVAGRKGSYEIM
jgi:hypothetical protein